MFDLTDVYNFSSEPMRHMATTKPNIRTGEGRMKLRGRDKIGDLKKKIHRKMAKKSRKANRR